jgi:signal transduction histidine kinase
VADASAARRSGRRLHRPGRDAVHAGRADATLGFAASRLLGGLAFSLGLLLVTVAGAELFTGNNLIAMAWAGRQVTSGQLLRNWALVCTANLAGATGLALLSWWAIRRALAPLRALGTQLAARPAHAAAPVALPGQTPAEIVPLVGSLDGLLGRIESMLEAERRFTADAAHELRTPIAAVRTQAQVALAETDDARRSHALRATLEGCDRAAHLVDQMLTLSRLESGARVNLQPVDLAAVARNVVAELAPQALRAAGPGASDAGPGHDRRRRDAAIVRRIAEVHALAVTVQRSSTLGGLAVTVTASGAHAHAASSSSPITSREAPT